MANTQNMANTRKERLSARTQLSEDRKEEAARKKKAKERERRKTISKKQETIKKRQREAARQRRAAERQDKDLHEENKRKERERWHRRVAAGKIKTYSDMTDREKRSAQRKRKETNKKYYGKKNKERQVQEEIQPDFVTPTVTEKPKNKAVLGRKKVANNRSAVHRKLLKQIEVNTELKKNVWKFKKRLQRAKKKISTPSPNTKINQDFKGRKLFPNVRRKLVFGEAIRRALKASLNRKDEREKNIAYKIFSGSLVRHYRYQKKDLGLSAKLLKKYQNVSESPLNYKRMEQGRVHVKREKVEKFFLTEQASIECPDKKAFKIQFGSKKIKKRKRYLRGSLKDLYVSYCEYDDSPVSFSKFCALKPFYAVQKDLKERDTCLCEKCENMRLLVKALTNAKAISVYSPLALIRSLCCAEKKFECFKRQCRECKTKEIPFLDCEGEEENSAKMFKWVKISEEKTDKTGKPKIVKRTVKKEFLKTIAELKNELTNGLGKFMLHSFRDFHQLMTLKSKRENLLPSEMYLWVDFSENYDCKYGEEIQSHYYGASREQVTLHTGILYSGEEKQTFCTASKSPRHDPAAIVAHLAPILEKFMEPGVSILHFQSDSPTTQYRNKTLFFLICTYITSLYPQITSVIYNYTEAGHGKGVPDGVGAVVKTCADTAVKNGEDVHCFDALVSVLKKKCKKTHIGTVDEADIKKIDAIIPSSLQAFKGTMDVHQFKWEKEHPRQIHFNTASCYECPTNEECVHFRLQNSPWAIDGDNDYSKKNPEPIISGECAATSKATCAAPDEKCIDLGDWVAVKYGAFWYPGLVIKVSSKKLTVDFMVKHEKKEHLYLWPPESDKQCIEKTQILCKLKQPPRPVDRQHFDVPEEDAINNLCGQIA